MSLDAAKAQEILSITQLGQLVTGLVSTLVTAAQAGQSGVTEEQLNASFAEKDSELQLLAASIARAKTEGR